MPSRTNGASLAAEKLPMPASTNRLNDSFSSVGYLVPRRSPSVLDIFHCLFFLSNLDCSQDLLTTSHCQTVMSDDSLAFNASLDKPGSSSAVDGILTSQESMNWRCKTPYWPIAAHTKEDRSVCYVRGSLPTPLLAIILGALIRERIRKRHNQPMFSLFFVRVDSSRTFFACDYKLSLFDTSPGLPGKACPNLKLRFSALSSKFSSNLFFSTRCGIISKKGYTCTSLTQGFV